MINNTADLSFPVGTVVGFLGLAGDVKVRPSTNNPELLSDIKQVRAVLDDKKVVILKVRSLRLEKRMLIMRFKDHADRTAVEYLEDANLFAAQAELLPLEEEEFWVKDLVGVDVFTTTGDFVGKVVSIVYSGNDLLEIKRDGAEDNKTILVPFVKDLVPLVDLKKGRIEVSAIEGLLEPQ